MSFNYVIRTDLPPEKINALGLMVFAKWVEFALGQTSLGGAKIIYPSGKYAASIQYKQEGEASVAIVADENAAPEIGILEQGHGPIDLKSKLQHGRAYPMHRQQGTAANAPVGMRRIGPSRPGLKPSMWAQSRSETFSGFASIGPNSAPDSWIIPAMPAYAPALVLAMQAKEMAVG